MQCWRDTNLLGGGVRVDGGHQALLNAQAFLQQHMNDWGQAVGSARSVRNNVVLGGVVLFGVHTHHNRLQVTLARGRDDNFLGSSLDVAFCLGSLSEQTR